MNEEQATGNDRVALRNIEQQDLPTLFSFQLDAEANRLAATVPRNSEEFNTHWEDVLKDQTMTVRAILFDDELAGCISCFNMGGVNYVGYWIGQTFWGRGVATQALNLLLSLVPIRPLQARVAVHNIASIRVLQKCGFEIVGHQHSPRSERYKECEEAMLELHE